MNLRSEGIICWWVSPNTSQNIGYFFLFCFKSYIFHPPPQDYVDWFEPSENAHPMNLATEPKSRFVKSKHEHKKVRHGLLLLLPTSFDTDNKITCVSAPPLFFSLPPPLFFLLFLEVLDYLMRHACLCAAIYRNLVSLSWSLVFFCIFQFYSPPPSQIMKLVRGIRAGKITVKKKVDDNEMEDIWAVERPSRLEVGGVLWKRERGGGISD